MSRDPLLDPVRFVDQRTGAAPFLRKALRYLFPDHWSFLLGEVALYAFVVLVATGHVPRAVLRAEPVGHGLPRLATRRCRARTMSDAYRRPSTSRST